MKIKKRAAILPSWFTGPSDILTWSQEKLDLHCEGLPRLIPEVTYHRCMVILKALDLDGRLTRWGEHTVTIQFEDALSRERSILHFKREGCIRIADLKLVVKSPRIKTRECCEEYQKFFVGRESFGCDRSATSNRDRYGLPEFMQEDGK